jgi:hypothetical protein
MDRRRSLKQIATGVTGTIAAAALLQSCGGQGTTEAHLTMNTGSLNNAGSPLWGYLSLFDPTITNIKAARELLDNEEKRKKWEADPKLVLPFLNTNGISLAKGSVIGFQLLLIGFPARFAVAVNLTEHDHDEEQNAPGIDLVKRNRQIQDSLRSILQTDCDLLSKLAQKGG